MLFKLPDNVKNKNGMTLIEIIIVLAIFMLVITATYTVFGLGNRSFIVGNTQYDVQSDIRNVKLYIENQIRYATNLSIYDNTSIQEIIPGFSINSPPLDTFDYIVIDNGELVHYKSEDNSKIVIGSKILDTSFFSARESIDNKGLQLYLKGSDQTQSYFVEGEINLPNMSMFNFDINKGESDSLKTGNIIRFKTDPEAVIADRIVTPGDGDGNEEEPPSAPLFVNAYFFLVDEGDNRTRYDIRIDGFIVPWNSSETAFVATNIARDSSSIVTVTRSLGTETIVFRDASDGPVIFNDHLTFRISHAAGTIE